MLPSSVPLRRALFARGFSHSAVVLSEPSSPSSSVPSQTPIHPVSTAAFFPRTSFTVPEIRESYFLGHHHAALRTIESQISNVGVVIECRDLRLPLSSWNPTLDRALSSSGARRFVLYTKADLVADSSPDGTLQSTLGRFHAAQASRGTPLFWKKSSSAAPVLRALRDAAMHTDTLTGLRVFVVGMPNVGKSTLLNKLRNEGMGGGMAKVAATADYPGVTRKLSMPVRILGGKTRPQDGVPGEGVFLIDTPGVFMPYVADKEVMLKLALAHGIKDGIVAHEILADYLLYMMNRWDPALYARFCPPTNSVEELLDGVARRTGKKANAGGQDQAATWLVAQWRVGNLGRYALDEVTKETIDAKIDEFENPKISFRQAKKQAKEARKEMLAAKRMGQS